MAFAASRISAAPIVVGPATASRLARGLVVAAAVAGGVAGVLATDPAAAARAAANAGYELTRLLRAMAAIKAAMGLAVLGAVVWRLALPAGPARLAAYAAACAAMAAGVGLIWDMARLGLGAGLLHAGLIAAVVMLWRDPATGARLSATIAARRQAPPSRR